MASKRKVKKKSFKEDQLVTTAVKASRLVQEYFTHVVVGVVILVVAVAVILFVNNTRRNTARESESELARAMSEYNGRQTEAAALSFAKITDRYGGYPAGKVARYFLGKTYLSEGRYDEALGAFQDYLDAAGEDAEFACAAEIGVAVAYEGLENFSAAAELLERLSQTMDPEDPRYLDVLFQAARNYEKAGSREKAVEFYTLVDEKATGVLKDRAAVWLAILQ
jgi:tetratricopeptide (TPR) repeat protein